MSYEIEMEVKMELGTWVRFTPREIFHSKNHVYLHTIRAHTHKPNGWPIF